MKETVHDVEIQSNLAGCLVRVVVWIVLIAVLIIFALGVFMGIVLAGSR